MRNITGSALAALLVFNALFPIPAGIRELDEMRYRKASANPAVAGVVVLGTIMAAYGIYAAGNTVAMYENNRKKVYDDFLSYSGMSSESVDDACAGAVLSNGQIDLGALALSSIVGALPGFAAWLAGNGIAAVSGNSRTPGTSVVLVNGRQYRRWATVPECVNKANLPNWSEQGYRTFVGYSYTKSSVGWFYNGHRYYDSYLFYVSKNNSPYTLGRTAVTTTLNGYVALSVLDCAAIEVFVDSDYTYTRTASSNTSFTIVNENDRAKISWQQSFLSPAVDFVSNSSSYTVGSGELPGSPVAVTEAAQAGTAVVPAQVVNPFVPSDELLAVGYTRLDVLDSELANVKRDLADVTEDVVEMSGVISEQTEVIRGLQSVIEAQAASVSELESAVSVNDARVEALETSIDGLDEGINAAVNTLDDILDTIAPWTTSIGGILAALNPLAAILQGVQSIVNFVTSIAGVLTGVQSSPFDWLSSWWQTLAGWWSSLLQWLAVNDAASWWGTLSGWWQGLLDWAGATPVGVLAGEIVGALEGVQTGVASVTDAVSSAVADLVAALDGVLAGEVSVKQSDFGEGSRSLAFPSQVRSQFDALLDDKAPFCYVRRLQRVEQGIAETFSSNPSFYVDVPVPYMSDDLRFDAGMVLNQSWNGRTVAGYLRLMCTALLCSGMIALAIRVSMSVLGVGGGKND